MSAVRLQRQTAVYNDDDDDALTRDGSVFDLQFRYDIDTLSISKL